MNTAQTAARVDPVDPVDPARHEPPGSVGRALPPTHTGVARVIHLMPPQVLPHSASVQGTLALDLEPLLQQPKLRLVGAEPGDVRTFAAAFAQGVVDLLAGDRNPYQLLRWTSEEVYENLVHRAHTLGAVAPPGRRRHRLRAQVRRVHVQHHRKDAAEMTVVVKHGERCRALAARLEVRRGHWICVELQIG